MAVRPTSLVALLSEAAAERPDALAYRWLPRGKRGNDEIEWSYGILHERAKAIAAAVAKRLAPGARVLLVFDAGLEYVAGFFGCLYAGMIPVPCLPPSPQRLERTVPRLRGIVRDARPDLVLSEERLRELVEPLAVELDENLAWCFSSDWRDDGSAFEPQDPDPEGVAYLQYTSGSTSHPKGVVLTHRSVLEGLADNRIGTEWVKDPHMVSWAPAFHDLGLVYGLLQPLYEGFACTLLAPGHLLANPRCWLEAISATRATHTSGPNFAYQLCVDRIRENGVADLDLSCLQIAVMGGEPVRLRTVMDFSKRFSPAGFQERALSPCYGMAEAVLKVTAEMAESPRGVAFDPELLERGRVSDVYTGRLGRELVSCGRPGPRTRLEIVDPHTRERVGPGEIGEIWVQSPSLGRGYWNQPEASRERFGGHIAESGDGPFLRTGDVGFLREGCLIPVGRISDLIVIRGRNYYPQDIEAVAERCHPLLRPGCTAAFPIGSEKGDRVALLAEVRDRAEDAELHRVVDAIREHVMEAVGVSVAAVQLVPPRSIHKTSSGKIQRSRCRRSFLDRDLSPRLDWNAGDLDCDEEAALRLIRHHVARIVEKRGFGDGEVDATATLSSLGIDSLSALALADRIGAATGLSLPLSALGTDPTLSDLALRLVSDARPFGPPIDPDPTTRFEPFPLNEMQQAYLAGRSGWGPLSHVSVHGFVELSCAALDTGRIAWSWREVVRRHDMLRCALVSETLQVVRPFEDFESTELVEIEDLRGVHEKQRTHRLQLLRDEMSHAVHDAGSGKMYRIVGVRLSDTETRLLVSVDCLNIDLSSLALIFREWVELYEGRCLEQPPVLSFRDYVFAVADRDGEPPPRRDLDYWQSRIETMPPEPGLPWTHDVRSDRFERRSFRIGRERLIAIESRARERGLTLSCVLLSAFAHALAEYASSPSFTLNATHFNRWPVHPDVIRLAGDFTSVVPVAFHLDGNRRFDTVARETQAALWEGLEHRQGSGPRLQREFARLRGEPGRPHWTVVFTSGLGFGEGIGVLERFGHVVGGISQTPHVRLDCQIHPDGDGLRVHWDMLEGCIDSSVSVDGMLDGYERVVAKLADSEESWGSCLPVGVRGEDHRARRSYNATETPFRPRALHDPFEEMARAQPDAVAIRTPDRVLTYGELERRSAALAYKLQESGCRRGDRVVVCLPKGWAQIAAVMGVVRSGGVYVPVSPDWPARRKAYVTQRVAAMAAVGSDAEVDGLGVDVRFTAEDLETNGSDTSFEMTVDPEDLAYIVFTSGTTGQPKGVAMQHGSALNTVESVNRRFGIGADDRVLGLSSLSFDLSVYDIFGTLAAGGSLVLPEPHGVVDPYHWWSLLRDHDVTVWNSVPALMQLLIDADPGPLDALRVVLLSGDWIPVGMPGRIRARAEGCRIIGLGGATEAGIWSIAHEIEREVTSPSIPYGRPLPNQRVYVKDTALEDRPTGVPGEICIAGAGLARGYWDDPERTAEKFVRGPDGERLYRTGDLGVFHREGWIEILGRMDHQVKISGHRVEVEEIEAVLERHESVGRAAVVAPRLDGQRRLVAFYTPLGETEAAPHRPVPADGRGIEPAGIQILDPQERENFRKAAYGLRLDLESRECVALAGCDEDLTAFTKRRSARRFGSDPVRFEDLSQLLAGLRAESFEGTSLPRYRYPSAGATYAVQTYVHLATDRTDRGEGGIFYYHPHRNALYRISSQDLSPELHVEWNRQLAEGAAACLLFVADLAAIRPLYGELAERLCTVESGYMGQLLMERAIDVGLAVCPIGGVDFDVVRAILGLSEDCLLVHGMLIGSLYGMARKPHRLRDELRAHLRRELPHHMIPATLIELSEMPLSENGKLDRKGLEDAATRTSKRKSQRQREQPPSDVHAFVQRALGSTSIGVEENLLDLGFDSIDLLRLQREILEEYGIRIAAADFVERPTISTIETLLGPSARTPAPEGIAEAADRGRNRSRRLGAIRNRKPVTD